MQNYKNLAVYKEAEILILGIYDITKKFPQEEVYSMTQQMRRAALSIGANIAEGTGRKSDADFLRFLYNAMGSLKELGHFFNIANKLQYVTQEEYATFMEQIEKLGNMLGNLIKSIKLASSF